MRQAQGQRFSRDCVGCRVYFDKGFCCKQMKEKAMAENKYIFVDCFSTWCGPCKRMDRNVFTIDCVGGVVKGHFIVDRVQFDTSKNDEDRVIAWYAVVHQVV